MRHIHQFSSPTLCSCCLNLCIAQELGLQHVSGSEALWAGEASEPICAVHCTAVNMHRSCWNLLSHKPLCLSCCAQGSAVRAATYKCQRGIMPAPTQAAIVLECNQPSPIQATRSGRKRARNGARSSCFAVSPAWHSRQRTAHPIIDSKPNTREQLCIQLGSMNRSQHSWCDACPLTVGMTVVCTAGSCPAGA